MEEVDIGTLSAAVFTRVEYDLSGRPTAVFVSQDGDTFAVDRTALHWRLRYLETRGMDTMEERKALKALAAVGG